MVCSGFLCYFDTSFLSTSTGLHPDLNWLLLSLLAAITISIFYGLFFGIAHAFNFQQLERYSKSELLNALATAFMAIFLVYLIIQVEQFALNNFICSPDPTDPTSRVCPDFTCAGQTITVDQLKSSMDLLKCRLGDKALAFAQVQEELSREAALPDSVFNLLNTYVGLVGLPVFQGNYISSWYKEVETFRLINNFLTNLLVGTNTLIVVSDYIKNNMLTFFLPLGLILRAFHFTRSIGAFFMALAIGFYFIFPLLYILTDPGFVRPTFTSSSPLDQEQPLCYPTFTGIAYSLNSPERTSGASGGTSISLDQLRNDVSSIYSSLIIQPFVVFSITTIFIRYLTTVLGGESQDILRGLAKVV